MEHDSSKSNTRWVVFWFRITLTTDLVNNVVAKSHIPEGASWAGLAIFVVFEDLVDPLANFQMISIGFPID